MVKVTNKGKFKPGNQAAKKPHRCPYCNKELSVRNYTYIKKKSNDSVVKRIDTKQEKVQ